MHTKNLVRSTFHFCSPLSSSADTFHCSWTLLCFSCDSCQTKCSLEESIKPFASIGNTYYYFCFCLCLQILELARVVRNIRRSLCSPRSGSPLREQTGEQKRRGKWNENRNPGNRLADYTNNWSLQHRMCQTCCSFYCLSSSRHLHWV